MNILRIAALEFISLRDRNKHPVGTFCKNGSWVASNAERRSCCAGIRTPSRNYPYSEMVHCRTLVHVACVYGLEESALRYEVNCIERDIDETKEYQKQLKRISIHSNKNKHSGFTLISAL